MLRPLLRTPRTHATRLLAHPAHRFSSRRHISLDPNQSIYISESTNPYFNLTLEDWLFKYKPPKEPLLLLYRDSPCVVIGRNQNPWKEVNIPALNEAGIPFIRRRSGGGTVYHDLGNTNFSIHLPRSEFDRHATAQVILRAVRSLDLDANVNDRNDICVGPYKVSGSAYKIVKERAYHHGTMLISSGLSTLGEVLHVSKDAMITKGVASVRSPVRNLCDFQPNITHEAFVDAVVQAFRDEYGISAPVREVEENESSSIPYIRDGMAELPSWDWAFGQTPEFTYTVQQSFPWGDVAAKIRSKHGIILSCELSSGNLPVQECLEELAAELEDKPYAFVDDASLYMDLTGPVGEVWHWIKAEMSR
ncbi:Lipoyltransferase and lipoate-protein ligase [Dentipellis sp. KUC8613]|nr:Lipoyltransferase and lipoate-protein ligase [Dentipellis sp. KUC8613]